MNKIKAKRILIEKSSKLIYFPSDFKLAGCWLLVNKIVPTRKKNYPEIIQMGLRLVDNRL